MEGSLNTNKSSLYQYCLAHGHAFLGLGMEENIRGRRFHCCETKVGPKYLCPQCKGPTKTRHAFHISYPSLVS